MRDVIITGVCYPPNNSNKANARLVVHSIDKFELFIEQEMVQSGSMHDLKFSDRIGSINRKIFFPNGNQFETSDNNTIDQILKASSHKNNKTSIVNRLESSWGFALVSVFLTVLGVTAFFKFGLPAAAQYGSKQIPVSTAETMSDQALQVMDRIATKPTALDHTTTEEIAERFNRRLDGITDKGKFSYQLHFRQMGEKGGLANAFALPGGDIIVTDALVALTTDDELDSILFHEIGHVEERHGLTAVIRASAMSVVVTMALGDLSAVAELTAGVATFFVQSNYTRNAEAQADDYALTQLVRQNMDPIHFATAMRKLESQSNPNFKVEAEGNQNYLSTHPSSSARIKKAEELSRVFNKSQ